MKNSIGIWLVAAMAAGVQAADNGGWSHLFDGKSLDGWEQRNGTATYRVEKGTIVGKTTEGSPNSFLCTTREYANFELEFEVKVDDSLNSGVQIRSQTKDTHTGRVNGPQIEICAGGAAGTVAGYVYGEACGGWMTPDDKRKPHKAFKNGEWNKYRVVAQGPKIQVWINGQEIGEVADEAKFQTHAKGFIGLQVHGVKKGAGPFEVAWRNIRLRELK